MATRKTWDDATRGLARRLRPLYRNMSAAALAATVTGAGAALIVGSRRLR